MKRIWTFLLTITLLTALAVPARADVLWSPMDNPFYEQHHSELDTVIRYFLANGEEGFVTLWDAPNGSRVTAQYENGERLLVYYTYGDWALITVRGRTDSGEWTETNGWTRLSDLSLIYDCTSFREEYASEIHSYRDERSLFDGSAETVNFYEYPGAAEVKDQMEPAKFQEILTEGAAQVIDSVFTDEEGHTWGYIPRYMFVRESWLCLDDPGGTDFPVREVPEVEFTPPQTPVRPAAAYAPYILVAGVVVVTAGLLFWFYGRKRGENPKG